MVLGETEGGKRMKKGIYKRKSLITFPAGLGDVASMVPAGAVAGR